MPTRICDLNLDSLHEILTLVDGIDIIRLRLVGHALLWHKISNRLIALIFHGPQHFATFPSCAFDLLRLENLEVYDSISSVGYPMKLLGLGLRPARKQRAAIRTTHIRALLASTCLVHSSTTIGLSPTPTMASNLAHSCPLARTISRLHLSNVIRLRAVVLRGGC